PAAIALLALDLSGDPAIHAAGKLDLTGIRYLPARDELVAGSFDQYVRVWKVGQSSPIAKLEGTGPLFALDVDARSHWIVAIGGVSPAIWSATSYASPGVLEGHTDLVISGGFVAHGLVVTASRDKTARIWDLDHMRAVAIIPGAEAVAI